MPLIGRNRASARQGHSLSRVAGAKGWYTASAPRASTQDRTSRAVMVLCVPLDGRQATEPGTGARANNGSAMVRSRRRLCMVSGSKALECSSWSIACHSQLAFVEAVKKSASGNRVAELGRLPAADGECDIDACSAIALERTRLEAIRACHGIPSRSHESAHHCIGRSSVPSMAVPRNCSMPNVIDTVLRSLASVGTTKLRRASPK